jgi:hypothetical protein
MQPGEVGPGRTGEHLSVRLEMRHVRRDETQRRFLRFRQLAQGDRCRGGYELRSAADFQRRENAEKLPVDGRSRQDREAVLALFVRHQIDMP